MSTETSEEDGWAMRRGRSGRAQPLGQLVGLGVVAGGERSAATANFLRRPVRRAPFLLGLAGSAAAGKSTTARILQALLAGQVGVADIVATDGFLLPNRVLEERRLLARKGFPESYDRRARLRLLLAVRAGSEDVQAPVYDHVSTRCSRTSVRCSTGRTS